MALAPSNSSGSVKQVELCWPFAAQDKTQGQVHTRLGSDQNPLTPSAPASSTESLRGSRQEREWTTSRTPGQHPASS